MDLTIGELSEQGASLSIIWNNFFQERWSWRRRYNFWKDHWLLEWGWGLHLPNESSTELGTKPFTLLSRLEGFANNHKVASRFHRILVSNAFDWIQFWVDSVFDLIQFWLDPVLSGSSQPLLLRRFLMIVRSNQGWKADTWKIHDQHIVRLF